MNRLARFEGPQGFHRIKVASQNFGEAAAAAFTPLAKVFRGFAGKHAPSLTLPRSASLRKGGDLVQGLKCQAV